MAGIIYTSADEYQVRLGLEKSDLEAKTDKLFSETIVSIFPPQSCGSYSSRYTWGSEEYFECIEDKYKYFLIVQTVVENSKLWRQNGDDSLLPISNDDLCQTKMVIICQIFKKMHIQYILGYC